MNETTTTTTTTNTTTKPIEDDFTQSVYNISMDAMVMAFALAVALAWNTAIKYAIQKYWKTANSISMHFIYAISITIVFAVSIIIAKKQLGYRKDLGFSIVGV